MSATNLTGVSALAFEEPFASSTRGTRRSGLRTLGLMVGKEFGDRFRNGWVIALAAVWLGAICLTSFFGLVQIGQLGMQGYERTVVSLLHLVQYLVPLLGLLMGHDLLVSEREDRTLPLLLATGLSRATLVAGKFLGGALAICFPLILGFVVSGIVIGLNTGSAGLAAFVKLACSGLVLAIVFVAAGLAISSLLRTRVQALVAALLAWFFAVFVFDLVALGALLVVQAPSAAQEIEIACDTTHVNSMAEIHGAFDQPGDASSARPASPKAAAFSWILLNPVDLFRTINLPGHLRPVIPPLLIAATLAVWITGLIGLTLRRFRSLDL